MDGMCGQSLLVGGQAHIVFQPRVLGATPLSMYGNTAQHNKFAYPPFHLLVTCW